MACPKAHITLGGEAWSVKFPCRIDLSDIGKREYRANQVAKACGSISMNFACSRPAFVQGISAQSQSNLDYGHLFRVIENICPEKEEMYDAFRWMCFNVYYENKDGHSKNFAFLFGEKRGVYRLSPAYDLTRTADKFEHEMTVNREGNPNDDNLLMLAKEFRLSLSACREITKNCKEIV